MLKTKISEEALRINTYNLPFGIIEQFSQIADTIDIHKITWCGCRDTFQGSIKKHFLIYNVSQYAPNLQAKELKKIRIFFKRLEKHINLLPKERMKWHLVNSDRKLSICYVRMSDFWEEPLRKSFMSAAIKSFMQHCAPNVTPKIPIKEILSPSFSVKQYFPATFIASDMFLDGYTEILTKVTGGWVDTFSGATRETVCKMLGKPKRYHKIALDLIN